MAVLYLRGGAQLWTGCLRDAVMETSRRQDKTRQDKTGEKGFFQELSEHLLTAQLHSDLCLFI